VNGASLPGLRGRDFQVMTSIDVERIISDVEIEEMKNGKKSYIHSKDLATAIENLRDFLEARSVTYTSKVPEYWKSQLR
jgi:hypothetical protein